MPGGPGKSEPYMLPPESAAAIYMTIDNLRAEIRQDREDRQQSVHDVMRGISEIKETLGAGQVMFTQHSMMISQQRKEIDRNNDRIDDLEQPSSDRHKKKEDFRIKLFNSFVIGIVTVVAASFGGIMVKILTKAAQEPVDPAKATHVSP